MNCPLCKSRACQSFKSANQNSEVYRCESCGEFTISAFAIERLGDNAWKVAAYVKEHNLRGIKPYLWYSQKAITADAAENSVGIDTAIDAFPKTVTERLDRALINLASVTTTLGKV